MLRIRFFQFTPFGRTSNREWRTNDAKFVIDVKRPDTTGSVIPYIESGAAENRITAAAVYVAGAHVCRFATDHCTEFTASAKLRTMAMLQLAEKIAKHVTTTDP